MREHAMQSLGTFSTWNPSIPFCSNLQQQDTPARLSKNKPVGRKNWRMISVFLKVSWNMSLLGSSPRMIRDDTCISSPYSFTWQRANRGMMITCQSTHTRLCFTCINPFTASPNRKDYHHRTIPRFSET